MANFMGRFYKDGPKAKILTSANISRLFKTPVRIRKENYYYYTRYDAAENNS
jgi:hypothetical protein